MKAYLNWSACEICGNPSNECICDEIDIDADNAEYDPRVEKEVKEKVEEKLENNK